MKQDPTLYEQWRPASTCKITSLIGPAIGAGISLIGGSRAAGAARDAAGAQVEAARMATELGREGLDFQKETFDISRADLDPYRASGGAALGTLNDLFIPGGQGVVQMHSRLNELRARRAVLARTGNQPVASPVQQGGTPTSAGAGGSFLSNFEESYRRQFTGEASDPLGIL